ncbi:Tubulin alpha-1 chain, partial [Gryllus bimaculatus]
MPKKHEVIAIHVGQPGVQIGSALWELFCLEHGIRPDGYLYNENEWYDDYDAVFSLDSEGKITPRALMIDLEPSVVAYRELFPPELLLTGKEDAASNYGRAFCNLGPGILDDAVERIRCIAEDCPLLQGLVIFRGLGGGTGSGFMDLFSEQLADEFGKEFKIHFSICPSPQISSNTTEPYNALLTTHGSLPHENMCVLIDNQSIYRMLDILQVPHPTFTNVNRLIAQVIAINSPKHLEGMLLLIIVVSAVTTSMRFEGPLNSDILELVTNLLPFPRIHFPCVSYAPLIPGHKCKCAVPETPSVIELTTECFDECNHFLMCDMEQGQYLSCCMFFRGDVCPTDINYAIYVIKKHKIVNFVDWCPTGFKIAINYQPPTTVPIGDLAPTPRAVCMLVNSTAIMQVWERLLAKFECLYERKAFVHHYINEGLEESLFQESAETVNSLIDDYKETETDNYEDDD